METRYDKEKQSTHLVSYSGTVMVVIPVLTSFKPSLVKSSNQ